MLINNDGGHQTQTLEAKTGLKKGLHPIKLNYFQMGRAKKLLLEWSSKTMKSGEIPENVLFH